MKKLTLRHLLIIACLAICCLMLVMLFDVKMTEGGDDSTYVQGAFYFLKEGRLPGYQGPLYPIMLSPVILFAGINLVILKLSSALFLLLFLFIFYKLYIKVVSAGVLLLIIIWCAVNSHLLYYGYQLYSEAFFLLLMVSTLFFFNRAFIVPNKYPPVRKHLLLALLLLSCFLTRTAGIFCIPGIVLFFLAYKQWKELLYNIGAIGVVFILYFTGKKIIWPAAEGVYFKTQLLSLMQKDFYDQSKGYENLTGMLQRLIDNSHEYFSYHGMNILGFLRDTNFHTNAMITLLCCILLGWALWFHYGRNQLLFLTGVMIFSGCIVSFLALQASWNQERIILIYVPFILVVLAAALEKWRPAGINAGMPVACTVLAFSAVVNLKTTLVKIDEHNSERIENLSGNLLYGYTPDVRNYIEAARWCGKNISGDSAFACRKPSIAFIFSGVPNFGIYNVPAVTENALADSCRDHLKTSILADISGILSNVAAFRDLSSSFGRYIYAVVPFRINTTSDRVGVIYRVPNELKNTLAEKLKTYAIPGQSGIPDILAEFKKEHYEYNIYPVDMLKQNLVQRKVSHMILASLRLVPGQNTGNIISTLHLYAFYLSLKYPNMFVPVKTIGDAEPAIVYKVCYPVE